ncbi:MAG TPA: GIY-YIG nuclease family protein [Firmicutes bacterium]|nr:GIY-YIG nuclease family protein [Bacillota bacterium]
MDGGLYLLLLRLDEPEEITVGRLGRFEFPSGYYIYVGRAKRGLYLRAARHRRGSKRPRWHIDYLRERADWVGVEVRFGQDGECELARKVAELPGAEELVPGFGSSDCGCRTHLFYFRKLPWEEM